MKITNATRSIVFYVETDESELKDEEVDKVLGLQICYKSNEPCKFNCSGLCRESC
jgi:hypothetical protein